MGEESFDTLKHSILDCVQNIFREIEEELVVSHQEKYTLLEDALESAVDESELRVAFEQWFQEHAEEIDFDYDMDGLWAYALSNEDDE